MPCSRTGTYLFDLLDGGKPSLGAGPYKRIVARTITPATPQITTITNRKCMTTPPLPKDHCDGDRRN